MSPWAWFRHRFPSVSDSDRWVVVDTETSGPDPHRDRLLSLGAVALYRGALQAADSLELTIADTQPLPTGNVLIHGLGDQTRAAGIPCREALTQWRQFRGNDPLIGFHAGFDRQVLQTAARRCGLLPDHRRWLDVAYLARALHPVAARRCHTLDDWLTHFGLGVLHRHHAVGDALATAELFLRLYADAGRPARFGTLLRRARVEDHGLVDRA